MIKLTRDAIDTGSMLAGATSPESGAVLLFLGVTREMTDGNQTVALDYEAYEQMAEQELAKLEREARARWRLIDCQIVHRLGRVAAGEASVAIVASSAHRPEAFAAGQWLIDTLKKVVPIWKREQWADGCTEWVHPGLPASSKIEVSGS